MQGCRELFKNGGGGQMGRLSWGQVWGGGQIGAKSWIFQTELGPIPVTRCDQCYAFFPPGIALSNNMQAQHIFKSEKY